MIKDFINKLLEGLVGPSLRKQEMNYTDLSQGLRHPLSPSGVLVQNDGNVQIYAGSGSITCDQKHNAVRVAASDIMLQGGGIHLVPSSIEDFTILGRVLNKELFYGNISLVTTTSDLSQYSLLTNQSWVDQSGQVHNTTPVSEVFSKTQLTKSITPDSNLTNTVLDLSEILGIEMPGVFKND